MQFFYDMKFDLIITLTYVLMDNFCPGFCYPLIFKVNLLLLPRDAQARLTISSPLEAHKTNTIVFHMVGVDVGFENPLFACLEIDYEEADNDPSG